jgi:hypothetical protein
MEFLSNILGSNFKAPNLLEEMEDKPKEQGIGEHCGGRDLEECKRLFGNRLDKACKTCPN